MNILLKEIFAGIFVSIACWNRPYDLLECSDKPSKFNSFAFTLSAVLYLCVNWLYKVFIHWWMKRIYFASFYFRVWDLTREIRENKNPAKISTYTVFLIFHTSCIEMNQQFQGPFAPLVLTFCGPSPNFEGNLPKGLPYFDPCFLDNWNRF